MRIFVNDQGQCKTTISVRPDSEGCTEVDFIHKLREKFQYKKAGRFFSRSPKGNSTLSS